MNNIYFAVENDYLLTKYLFIRYNVAHVAKKNQIFELRKRVNSYTIPRYRTSRN